MAWEKSGWFRTLVVLAALVIVGGLIGCAEAQQVEFFILWGMEGRWNGGLEVENGRFLKVEPYSFETQYGDKWEGADERRASWRSGTGGQLDGIHVTASIGEKTVFHFKTEAYSRDLRWSDFPADADAMISIQGRKKFLVLGRGNPERGPRGLPGAVPLPNLFQPPQPVNPLPMPDECGKADVPVIVRLSQAPFQIGPHKAAAARGILFGTGQAPPGPLAVRRGAKGDGRLYLEIYSSDGPLAGAAEIEFAGKKIGSRNLSGSLWLSLQPRIGTVKIQVSHSGTAAPSLLTAPTTLIEIRGPKLYLNGESFLVKGTLPRDLNDTDAEYLKSLCANTIRIRAQDLDCLDKYGFMGIVMTGRWDARFCEKAETDEEFYATLKKCLEGHQERCQQVVLNPRGLIVQHANEQVFGTEAWIGRCGSHSFDRLDYLLAVCYNLSKPLDPMMPQGYSNCALGYRAPDFLDVYLHNTYLDKDRGWPPLAEFMKFQSCDRRPYLHTEFGANVYMPQAHVGGKNTPILEKIHAWNYPNRWKTYLGAGTLGGTNYCFYDYNYGFFEKVLKENPEKLKDFWDRGFTNFGVMTFDRKPKLACWELWHLWRDFEVEPQDDQKLRIRYVRDYWARDCQLALRNDAGEEALALEDFAPNSKRVVTARASLAKFRWRMDYTTHGGLTMVACGAHPSSVEAEDFLARLKDRETFPFLRELFDAEVLNAEGRRDATTLKDMEREDGVVPIAFRKPTGVVYVSALARKKPAKGSYQEGVNIDLAFKGQVEAVDEMTGKPTGAPVEVEKLPNGIRIKNVRVPFIPAGYGARLQVPVSMPVFRITPLRGKDLG